LQLQLKVVLPNQGSLTEVRGSVRLTSLH